MKALLPILMLLILLACGTPEPVPEQAPTKAPEKADCDLNQGPCAKALDAPVDMAVEVELEINPRPIPAMEDIRFTVRLLDEQGAAAALPSETRAYIDLTMPGMDMGKNLVEMGSAEDGVFHGTGTVVRCPSGGRTWNAGVRIVQGDTESRADFLFEVQ